MGFSQGGGQGAKSDINVTPLVDVVLVLLIIFLVAMPVVMKEIDVEVPKKIDDPPDTVVVPDQITVEITKGGGVLLNGVEINRVDLAGKLRDRLEHKREKVVFVDFDELTRYGDVVSIMDTCRGAAWQESCREKPDDCVKVALKLKEETPPGAAPGAPVPVVTPQNK